MLAWRARGQSGRAGRPADGRLCLERQTHDEPPRHVCVVDASSASRVGIRQDAFRTEPGSNNESMSYTEHPVVVEQKPDRAEIQTLAGNVGVASREMRAARAHAHREPAQHNFRRVVTNFGVNGRVPVVAEARVRYLSADRHSLRNTRLDLRRCNVEWNAEWVHGDVRAIWNRNEGRALRMRRGCGKGDSSGDGNSYTNSQCTLPEGLCAWHAAKAKHAPRAMAAAPIATLLLGPS
jgi:hypothetical protein